MLGEKLHPSQTTNDQSIIRVTAVNTKTRDGVRSKTRDCFCCRSIESNEEMKTYDRTCIYVDNQFKAEDRFTVRTREIHTTEGNTSVTFFFILSLILYYRNCVSLYARWGQQVLPLEEMANKKKRILNVSVWLLLFINFSDLAMIECDENLKL